MLVRVDSSAILGVDAYVVEVECDVAMGMSSFTIVGLPDVAVKESGERVRAAIRNTGYEFPWNKRVTINLAPADIKKSAPFTISLSRSGSLPPVDRYPASFLTT